MDVSVYIVIAVVVVGIALGAGLALLRRPRGLERGRRPSTQEVPALRDRTSSPDIGVTEVAPETAIPVVEEPAVEEPVDEIAVWEVEVPAPATGRMRRLRARLARSQNVLGQGLLTLLTRDRVDDGTWDEVEELLLTSDLGVGPTRELLGRLKSRVRVEGGSRPDEISTLLREELLAMVGPDMDRTLITEAPGRPAVILVVGVNGTGKTTTTGKLARVLIAEDRTVLLGAADTFRAAASDQLQTWGDRVGAPVVRGPEGSDPAAIAFDAVTTAADAQIDVAIIDTAGRLHTKTGLMDELGKVRRVVEKRSAVDEVLLVLDATTGQNGLTQARVFAEAVDITGIVLTKLDGTARGGIVVAVQSELGVPVKLVGLGEGPDDLAPFEPEEFVDALLATA